MQNLKYLHAVSRAALTLIAAILITASALAEVPSLVSYQGRLTGLDGNPLDTTVSVTFLIYGDSTGGSSLWSETHPAVVAGDGLFNVLLGSINQITPDLFNGTTCYLALQVGSGSESVPRTPIVSVGYAFRAINADTAAYALASPGSGSSSGWVDDGASVRLETPGDNVGIGTDTPTEKLDVDGNARVADTLYVGGKIFLDGPSPVITATNSPIINFDSTEIRTFGDISIGGVPYVNKKLCVAQDGSKDTIPLWVRNQEGTAGAFFSHTTGTGFPADANALFASADDTANAARFFANGDGFGVYARTQGAGNTFHGYAAGTGYSGFFEGGMGLKVDGDLEATGSFKLPAGAAAGRVLTSDANGIASWQSAGPASPWTFDGSNVYLGDTTFTASVGLTTPLADKRFSVKTTGTNATMALWAQNTTGTAAGFFSGEDGNWSPGNKSAIFARAEGLGYGGTFSADSGRALSLSSFGASATLYSRNYDSGYAGHFYGGDGVKIDGNLEATGRIKLPYGAGDGLILTSDASGLASWQAGESSPWTIDGGDVVLTDTSLHVSIGGSGVQINGALEVLGDVIISGKTVFGAEHGSVDSFSTISGGFSNSAWGEYSVVGGGINNSATGLKSTVGGGESNAATSLASTIGGGADNSIVGPKGTIGGGYLNRVVGSGATVGGGENNNAVGNNSVISGGGSVFEADSNYAHGAASTVPGGRRNGAVGDLSFAAGYRAKASHNGTFVWADDTESDFSSTQTDQFLIRATNGVGMGVTDPEGQLDITDNSDGIALHIRDAIRDVAWPTGQSLQFGDWDGVTFNPRMRINIDGNIGVNTTAPNGALHVRGNSDGMALHLSAASGDISWPTNNTLNMGTWDGATFNEHMRITAGGNVGIGVSSTPNILTVQQYSATDPIADSWGTYSSRRWKRNIRTLDGALDRVLRLRGVSYDWKETGEHDIGLIAEEVGEIVPEVVHYEENGIDAQSVDYARLVAILIEAVKEQEQTIQLQNKSIEELRSLVTGMQHTLDNIVSNESVAGVGNR